MEIDNHQQLNELKWGSSSDENEEQEEMEVEKTINDKDGITPPSSYSSQSQTIVSKQKTNIIKKQKNDKSDLQMVCFNITPIISQSSSIDLFTGLQISNDGTIRFYPSLSQVYFGFNQQKAFKVEEFRNIGVINIDFEIESCFQRNSFKSAYNFLNSISNVQYQYAQNVLQKTEDMLVQLFSLIQLEEFNELRHKFKEEEFKQFQKMCMNFLAEFNKMYPYKMYSYQICRINLQNQDLQFSNQGYSKAYLDFLGVDSTSLSQIILRNKQIDLIKRKYDITNIALYGLQNVGKDSQEPFISEIITFDGFPINLIQKKREYGTLFNSQPIVEGEYQYHFTVVEMDVNLYDLEQLIQYRQRIQNNCQNISIDDFIQKELSFLFEDVEYSIQSQSFIEKYYSDNLTELEKQRELIQKKCNFKSIHYN